MENLKTLAAAIAIGAFWFFSAYFAASFLPFPFPLYALNCAFFNLGLSLLAYAYLVARGRHKEGLLMGMVILFPVVYVTIGLIWILIRPIFDIIVRWLN
jgi:hypothetical protein